MISTGGTGVTGRDVTPEALERVAEKLIPGFGELFRLISFRRSAPRRCSRARPRASPAAPICSRCRARPAPASDGWDEILSSQLDIRHRPCNFAELLPRLREHETG